MKSELEIIVEDLQKISAYTNDTLDHVDDADWFRQPADGINHIAWQVGHIAIAQYGLCLKRVRGFSSDDDQLFPVSEYAKLFGKGSQPNPDPEVYPAPEAIRKSLKAIQQQVIEETSQLSQETLDEAIDPVHPMFSTKGEALRFAPKHEMLHVGQIAMLRRLFGHESLR
ncbi:DinB superfamily protein [Thalassoglobus neptunius]|uniref:DinB superfamily protein n=1 Tax=Thalassoglobus neptunius TaxID=1938619 RepID=A0A5C5X376_9PLAN|nr:DinB family protein [Thalassoglobus neptunius]TWT57406.1 DinB superfamily protein [Thalassoglobus neptunius]